MSLEFFITALIVVLIPGTGVIYTLSMAMAGGRSVAIAAATGCTLGIVPHLAAAVFGLAALLHASALAFQLVRLAGVAYLLYLAWGLWRSSGSHGLAEREAGEDVTFTIRQLWRVGIRGTLINILNPKLSIFFLAFLPQFIPAESPTAIARMGGLGLVFMLMTFVVFVLYGLAADALRRRVLSSSRFMQGMQRVFALAFAGFAVRLALSESTTA